MEHKITLIFPDEESRNNFLVWFSDGGGEQEYFFASEAHDTEPISRINYERAFTTWGYDPEVHGHPQLIFARSSDED
jgi:hypothetical protein